MQNIDIEIDAKYESGKNRLLQQYERIKLPRLAENLRLNPKYMMINSDSQSSWDSVKQSRLIESLMINLPVPPIVLYEKNQESYIVIGGKQRLIAIAEFYSNKLALAGLEVEPELNGCTYITLPAKFKDLLARKSLSLITIIPENGLSHDEIARLIKIVAKRLESKRDAEML
jgi:hypothetical protein